MFTLDLRQMLERLVYIFIIIVTAFYDQTAINRNTSLFHGILLTDNCIGCVYNV